MTSPNVHSWWIVIILPMVASSRHCCVYSGSSKVFFLNKMRILMVSKLFLAICVRVWLENPSLGIIVCHHLAGLVMQRPYKQETQETILNI